MEHIARQALRVDPQEWRWPMSQVSHPNGNQFFLLAIHFGLNSMNPEISELSGKVCFGN
jgi:hypothetical protein